MTSSLVGSEMCIRDSIFSYHSTGCQKGATDARKGVVNLAVGHAPAVFWTVSYTHLTLPTICSV
eukprot:4357207-Prorocentrum_lima.AAC.1